MADTQDSTNCEDNKKMMKQYRKNQTKASETAAEILKHATSVGVSEAEEAMKNMTGNRDFKINTETSKALKEHHSAKQEGEVEFLANYLKLQLGINEQVKDPYGDGEQSTMKGIEAMKLRTQWATGFDYNPANNPRLSDWCKACFYANVDKVQKYLNGIVTEDDKVSLLERRESMIRFCGIFHVICGARVKPSKEHIEIAKLIIKAGCKLNAKDVAGYTPLHHCLSQYGNKTTLEIAKILVEEGADVNITNRFGCTSLFEPCMSFNYDFIEFLVCNGCDPSIKDNDGISCQIMSSRNPRVSSLFSKGYRAMAKTDKKKNGKASEDGCDYCGHSGKLSKCSGCLEIRYCSRACQTHDWKQHKPQCKVRHKNKMSDGDFVNVKPVTNPFGKEIVTYNEKSKKVHVTEKDAGKKQQHNSEKAMKVKIQVCIQYIII